LNGRDELSAYMVVNETRQLLKQYCGTTHAVRAKVETGYLENNPGNGILTLKVRGGGLFSECEFHRENLQLPMNVFSKRFIEPLVLDIRDRVQKVSHQADAANPCPVQGDMIEAGDHS
jgi:hypothetical protein